MTTAARRSASRRDVRVDGRVASRRRSALRSLAHGGWFVPPGERADTFFLLMIINRPWRRPRPRPRVGRRANRLILGFPPRLGANRRLSHKEILKNADPHAGSFKGGIFRPQGGYVRRTHSSTNLELIGSTNSFTDFCPLGCYRP